MQAKDLDELIDAYRAHSDTIDVISLSTTWTRLGKYGVSGKSRAFVVDERALAFVRGGLLSRTLARVPDMTVRQVSNVLWAMGKLRLKLAEEKNGPYLAEQIEQRVLELLMKLKQGGFRSNLDGPQLWLGLGMCQYEWSSALLGELLKLTLAEMSKWDAQGISQVSMQIAKLCGGLLTPERKDQIKDYFLRLLRNAAREDDVAEMIASISMSLNAMQLKLAPSDLEGMASAIMNVPLPLARARGLTECTAALSSCVDLGYQPSALEAEAWLERLEEVGGEEWSKDDFTRVVSLLSRCKAYTPPSHMVEQVLREAPVCQVPIEAKRLLGAAHAWDIELPSASYSRLKELGLGWTGRGSRLQGESGREQRGGERGGGGRGRGRSTLR